LAAAVGERDYTFASVQALVRAAADDPDCFRLLIPSGAPRASRWEQGEPPDGQSEGQRGLTSWAGQRTLTPMAKAASDEVTTLAAATGSQDPDVGLAAVAALRGLVEVLEALQVERARAEGWSWQRIAARLGVTKHAVHRKYAGRRFRFRR
jgi:hypothetical protein